MLKIKNENWVDDRILVWIDSNGFKNSLGQPFEWYEHSFLLDPLCDFHPRQGWNKSAQVGGSEAAILKAIFLTYELEANVIYTLPSDNFLQKFVGPKVDPIIEANPLLRSMIKGGVTLKEVTKIVGNKKISRFIHFIGAFNSQASANQELSSKGVSVTAYVLINDEASRSDQFILQQMRSRLENSPYAAIFDFDNPARPGVGADGTYKISDQRHWFVKCSRCGHRQYLDWIRLDQFEFKKGALHCFVDPERKEFVCGKCAKPISDNDRITGEWVAKYPSITDYRGYWISQMCYVRHSAAKILLKEEDKRYPKSQFYNYVLGKPYIGSDVRVSRANIVSNMSSDINMLNKNVMGIDQGRIKWYVIGNEKGIFKVGWTESWDEIEFLFNKYNCTAVCDALPYQSDPKRLAAKYPNRFFRAFYKPEADQSELAKFSPKNDRTVVLIRRDETFDELVDKIVRNAWPIQVPLTDLEVFISHWENLIRVIEPDSNGNDRFTWTRVSDDHFAHASLYMETAKIKAGTGIVTGLKPKKITQPDTSIDTSKPVFGENLYNDFTQR